MLVNDSTDFLIDVTKLLPEKVLKSKVRELRDKLVVMKHQINELMEAVN